MFEQTVADQQRLSLIDQLGQRRPQSACLRHQRRNDQESDDDERADDEEVHRQDRQPAGQPLADRHDLLVLDRLDDRTEADREESADVDQEENIAGEIKRPDDDDAESRHRDGLRGRPEAAGQPTIGQGTPR